MDLKFKKDVDLIEFFNFNSNLLTCIESGKTKIVLHGVQGVEGSNPFTPTIDI